MLITSYDCILTDIGPRGERIGTWFDIFRDAKNWRGGPIVVHGRVEIGCDPAKRAKTLAERGLDFFDAVFVFAGPVMTLADIRRDYGENRFQTYGLLRGRWVQVVWTPRDDVHHVISMRHCHEREVRRLEERLGRPG